MKSSTKILIGVIVVISLIIGFFIGISVDYPKTNKSELAGTIGKIDNYRNVKVTENDIQLRSDLLSSEAFLKSYRQYYTFHYSSCVKLCDDIDFAIKAAENIPQFKEGYTIQIENVKQFRETLEQSRKDILLAISSLQKIEEVDAGNMTQIINNANIAVAQIKFREDCLLAFVESIEKFIQGNNPNQFSDLIKAHDLFAVNQLIMAAITNDKPMLKAYNNKQLMASHEGLSVVCSNEQLKSALQIDLNILQSELKNNELLKVTSNIQLSSFEGQLNSIISAVEKLGVIICSSSQSIGGYICSGSSENLGVTILSSEKLGVDNTAKLGVTNAEKLGMGNAQTIGLILNTDKLGQFMNSEKLGLYNADKLGVCNFEKLGLLSSEKLNAFI
jgi:hypothetical protein